MYKITGLNLLVAMFYSIIFFVLFNTGYIYASGLTTANFKYLLVFPLILIVWIFNVGLLWKLKSNKNALIIAYKVISTLFMIMISFQLVFVSAIFITLSTSGQILLHVMDALCLITIIALQLNLRRRKKA